MAVDARESRLAEATALLLLDEAAARLRARGSVDEVLATAADEARRATGGRGAWAARFDGAALGPIHASVEDGAGAATTEADVASSLLGLAAAAKPVANDGHGLVAAVVSGRDGAPVAVLAVTAPSGDASSASLEASLAALALLTGLTLDTARVRELLVASTRTRERLLASIAHDLRNPINTFAMGAALLRDDLGRDTADGARGIAMLDRMTRATARMQALVEDLSYASRAEAGQLELSIGAERVAELVAEAARTPSHGVVPIVPGDLDEGALVMADRARVKEIFDRLAACATRAVGESGSLRVSAAPRAGGVVLTAHALGPSGAPAPALDEIRSSLPLHVARGLVSALGGSLWVLPGPALAIAFTLPAAHASADPGAPTSASRAHAPADAPGAAGGGAPLEPSEYVRTELLRRVAHDIAAPVGVAATILDELAGMERPPPELLAMARRALRRLLRISERLALVAELEGGPVEPERAPRDLRELAKRAVDDALAVDGRKDVTLIYTPSGAPHVFAGEARLVVPALREVIGNALRFATSRVEISLARTVDAVELRVEDDGPGFSEEERAAFGRRFASRRTSGGLGLSLSTAVQIVRAHGGSVRVEPSSLPPGRRGTPGSAVIVSLPQVAPGAAGAGGGSLPEPDAPPSAP